MTKKETKKPRIDSLESEDALAHGAAPARLEAEDVLVGAVAPEALERPHVLPAAPVEDEVGGGDLDGALARHPAPLVDHGHDEGVGVAVVDVDPLGAVEGEADAVAVAHRGRRWQATTGRQAAATLHAVTSGSGGGSCKGRKRYI